MYIRSGDGFLSTEVYEAIGLKGGETNIQRFDSDFKNPLFQQALAPVVSMYIGDPANTLFRIQRKIKAWYPRPDTTIRTSHTVSGTSILLFPHEEIEFHVPIRSAEKFATWFPFVACPVPLITILRYTGTNHDHAYVSFNFDCFDPGQYSSMREFFSDLAAPPMDWGVWMHPGKGLYVNKQLINASLPSEYIRRKYDPKGVLDVYFIHDGRGTRCGPEDMLGHKERSSFGHYREH
jgi:hypothetical protein